MSDVKSLYTNIPHEYGLRAISFWLDKHHATISSRFPKAFIMESVQFILMNNNFKFNDEFFLQLIGMAMGTDMAPTYATLTMNLRSTRYVRSIGEEHSENTSRRTGAAF